MSALDPQRVAARLTPSMKAAMLRASQQRGDARWYAHVYPTSAGTLNALRARDLVYPFNSWLTPLGEQVREILASEASS